MARSQPNIDVYLEIGSKRTIAGVLDWPGWCRIGRDEQAALQALVDYGPRYGRVARSARFAFQSPADTSALQVVERLEGNATTDFGVPEQFPTRDRETFDDAELQRSRKLLRACWRAFDAAAAAADGHELSKGPRGGGRDLTGVVEHVLGAEAGYLSRLIWKWKRDHSADLDEQLAQTRAQVLKALAAAARGELPRQGPRGGVAWPPRYFVRRAAWHVLDHAWEIEDRVLPDSAPA